LTGVRVIGHRRVPRHGGGSGRYRLAGDRPALRYHLLPATRALTCCAGSTDAAAYHKALALAPTDIERRYLARQLAEIASGDPTGHLS
jgi:predicted RNA polymerase sigma factor